MTKFNVLTDDPWTTRSHELAVQDEVLVVLLDDEDDDFPAGRWGVCIETPAGERHWLSRALTRQHAGMQARYVRLHQSPQNR